MVETEWEQRLPSSSQVYWVFTEYDGLHEEDSAESEFYRVLLGFSWLKPSGSNCCSVLSPSTGSISICTEFYRVVLRRFAIQFLF